MEAVPYRDIVETVRDVDPIETEMGNMREKGKGEKGDGDKKKTSRWADLGRERMREGESKYKKSNKS